MTSEFALMFTQVKILVFIEHEHTLMISLLGSKFGAFPKELKLMR